MEKVILMGANLENVDVLCLKKLLLNVRVIYLICILIPTYSE